MNVDQILQELSAYFKANTSDVTAMFYSADVQLNQYCRKVTKVNGSYPSIHSVTNHVIQGFVSVWNELGSTSFKANELTARRIKVNFGLKPADILPTWLAQSYDEDASLADKSISKFIMEQELKPKVIDDLNILSGRGIYDANNLGTFGYAMDGIIRVIANGLANTDNPMYKVALDALTDSNMVAQVTKFERGLPSKVKSKVKRIFMSENNAERYMLDYEDKFGANTTFRDDKVMKTRLGKREIVGLNSLNGSDLIFASVDGNMLHLIDKFDKPEVTDLQKADYKLKIFMEANLGYNFAVNQLVFASNYDDATSGLGNADLNKLYYPEDYETITEISASASGV